MGKISRTALAVAFTVAPAAFAQTYIVANGDCGPVKLQVARDTGSGEHGAVSPSSVKTAYLVLPQQRVALKAAKGSQPLTFDATIPQDGVTMAAVDFQPVVAGNETRTEHAKTLVFCGAKTPAHDWQRTAGVGLEIYPQGWNGPRPQMKAGEPMRFIAVYDSKLLGELPMTLYKVGGGPIAEGVLASVRGMNFPYQAPGRYMVVATYRRADPQHPERSLVDVSTLTFDIK